MKGDHGVGDITSFGSSAVSHGAVCFGYKYQEGHS